MSHSIYAKHQDLLASAVHAIDSRGYWSPYEENPRVFGESAVEAGREAFEAYRDAQFYLDQPGLIGRGGGEESPYGIVLNISYPKCGTDALIAAAKGAMSSWVKAGPDTRVAVCAEILARLHDRACEMAFAVMHTTGQPFNMAYQSGPQALDRGLEAVALAWREMKHVPYRAIWEKPQAGKPSLRVAKEYLIAPRGVALVVACSTSPTWSSYPGLFASLATGNAVIVKPHPGAILPLAITVAVARQTLKELGFEPDLVSLLVDTQAAPVAREVATKPDIRLIDYTGGPEFCQWLRENAGQARVFAETAGVNCMVLDSTDDYAGLLRNLAITLSLYSGQMCATPQVLLVSREGLKTPEGLVSSEQFGRDLAMAVGQLLEEPARAAEILGAIQSPATLGRIDACRELGEVLRDSTTVEHPRFPAARIHSPLLLKVPVSALDAYGEERFGPISFIVDTASTSESLATAERLMRERGAITFLVYAVDPTIRELAEETALRAEVSLTFNFTGGLLVNQSAAFSDFHATGANPAANACITDGSFVADRFVVIQSQRPAP
jgi:phenylacetic acid degradation protein paaN